MADIDDELFELEQLVLKDAKSKDSINPPICKLEDSRIARLAICAITALALAQLVAFSIITLARAEAIPDSSPPLIKEYQKPLGLCQISYQVTIIPAYFCAKRSRPKAQLTQCIY
ncbi:hypothetical protein [Rhodospirillum sp. A1_3_36]|uniref:hypothetical protein n=1 Tax=Rhodospirillum sp. A1_3_36 TaxID=3391666 RepID=UPI0039A6A8CC